MKVAFRDRWLFLIAAAIGLAACNQEPVTGPLANNSKSTECYEGCWDTDSFPDSAGTFINYEVTPDACSPENETDTDEDGLSDFCEVHLAETFEPSLYYSSSDEDMDRDPKYAVRPLGYNENGIYEVVILYMPAYFQDGGTPYCEDWPLPADWVCGHYGDSEAIGLTVHFDENTSHWLVDGMHFSVHGGYHDSCSSEFCITADQGEYAPVAYADHDGGRPVAYVSMEKHANYLDYSDCNSATWEQCESDSYADIGLGDNIGSVDDQAIDCVHPTVYPYSVIYAANSECWWTTQEFYGWHALSPGCSPYSDRLYDFGFLPGDEMRRNKPLIPYSKSPSLNRRRSPTTGARHA